MTHPHVYLIYTSGLSYAYFELMPEMGLDFCLSSFSFVAASHSAFLKVCGSSGPTAVETQSQQQVNIYSLPRPRPLTRKMVWWPWAISWLCRLSNIDFEQKLIRWLHDERPVSLVYAHAWMMWHCFIGLSKIKTVDSARPRNRSIVTRPFFPCERVWSGHNYNETTSSKVVLPNKAHVPHICVSEEVSHLTSCHNTYSFGT